MNSKYSSGAEMKLPIYGSTSFRRHLEPQIKEEIIGDVFVTFNFSVPKKEATPTSAAANAAVTSSSSRKVVLESVRSNQRLSGTKSNEHVPKSGFSINEPPNTTSNTRKELVLCMLKIDKGRHFVANQSVYLTARLFSDTESISSSVCWNANDQPHFELHHVVPIEIDSEFLEKNCKNNHLVIEVWNFAKPTSNIIGVATIPLHQLHTAFSVSFEGSFSIIESTHGLSKTSFWQESF